MCVRQVPTHRVRTRTIGWLEADVRIDKETAFSLQPDAHPGVQQFHINQCVADGPRQVSWLAVLRTLRLPGHHQWHVQRSRPLTVAGAAVALLKGLSQNAPRSLLSRSERSTPKNRHNPSAVMGCQPLQFILFNISSYIRRKLDVASLPY